MPKGGKSSLTPVSAGIQEDLNAFLRGYIEIRSCSFTDFKELFKRMNMVTIFNGRSSDAEIIEFNESLLCACLKYLEPLAAPEVARCKEERIFGLYALYTFFYLQQIDYVVKIRMDPDIHKNFQEFLEILRADGNLDAWACGLKLQQDCAIKIVAFVEIFDPIFHKNFEDGDMTQKTPIAINIDVPTANLRNMLENDDFIKIKSCQKKYDVSKIHLKVDNNLVNSIITKDFEKIVQKFEKHHFEKCQKKSIELAKPALVKNEIIHRQVIKNEAYSADLKYSRTRRHRICKRKVEKEEEVEQKPAKMPKKGRKVRFSEVVDVRIVKENESSEALKKEELDVEQEEEDEINDIFTDHEDEEEDISEEEIEENEIDQPDELSFPNCFEDWQVE